MGCDVIAAATLPSSAEWTFSVHEIVPGPTDVTALHRVVEVE